MPVFVNRTLNMKKIKLIGFDMDYTLVPYNVEAFERLTYSLAQNRLVETLGYPEQVRTLEFDFNSAIVGLIIDKRNGFLLQLSRYNKVKSSRFGTEEVPFSVQNKIYENRAVDLRDSDYVSLDTSFAISYGVLFSQLVQLKKEGVDLPDFYQLEGDVMEAIDSLHKDDTLKSELRKDFPTYVIKDSRVGKMLERYKNAGKKLMLITNSDYGYTRTLLDYALNPFLEKHSRWQDVFDIVITLADKPKFFEQKGRFLNIDLESGLMSNHEGPVTEGLYQGGCSRVLQADLGLAGSEILYLGDHIYGDVVSIKKQCGWRTALVLGDLEVEMEGLRKSQVVQETIDSLMEEKEELENNINLIDIKKYEGKPANRGQLDELYRSIDALNSRISDLISQYRKFFNPYWGEILRAGSEESRYAEQVEKYACIYMTRVSDLYDHSPRTYFRPRKRILPHEATAWSCRE
ncbi:MAG: HAD-IG family 5'-nucleotidase [Spirochaetales bacterium]|nr:HAD-IG family 5'-nucleotidase [Spirochaetales bacterium]